MFLTTITFFFILSVLVLVHEGGHFLAAKKAGIKVEEFGFGYPPRVLGKKIGETVYSLNAIPFGGFVRLYGEEEGRGRRAFWAKSKKARTGVILAGVLANFLLGILAFSAVYSVAGIPTKSDEVKIVGIAKNSPAEKFGLKEGDVILAADDQRLTELSDFTKLIKEKSGREIKLLIKREKDSLILFLTPRENPPEGEGPLGVAVSNIEIKKYPIYQMPFRGAIEGFKEALGWGMIVLVSLKRMILDLVFLGVIPKDVAGPVGIFQVTSNVAQQGFLSIVQFMGVLSVNLAVLNVLPIPAMDGGKLLFVGYELITRRKPKPSVEKAINTVGLAFLIFLIILVTINDLIRLLKI